MNDADKKVFAALQLEIERLGSKKSRRDEANRLHRFGAFVDAALKHSRLTRADLAETLQMDGDLADAILDGGLPEDEVDDSVLVDIAGVIGYEPNLLRVMMGRPVDQTADPSRA